MEPPALSFIPNTQGSSARHPHPSCLRCCPRPTLGSELGWGGVGAGVVRPGKSRDVHGRGRNLLLGGRVDPTMTPPASGPQVVGWARSKNNGEG